MKTDRYICLDEATGEWQEASLAQLLEFNEPELRVCPVDRNGTPGQETSFREVIESLETKSKKKDASSPLPSATEADILFEIKMQEQIERLNTYRHVRRCCSILVSLGVAAVIGIDKSGNLLVLALIVALAFHIIFASAPTLVKKKKK